MVVRFSQEKLPLKTSQNCVTAMTPPAMAASGCGKKRNTGATSCAKWLPSTSTRWSGRGSRWKNHESGFGMGCVSWW